MLHRAHSILKVKSIEDDQRIIHGVATTPMTDLQNDIVLPQGGEFSLPLPLLWGHNPNQPVGNVLAANVTAAGIEVTCQFAAPTEPPSLKDDLDRAWAMVKAKLVRGLSIGFKAIESEPLPGGGTLFKRWDWLELSAVTIPANSRATITTIRAADMRAKPPLLRQAGLTAEQRKRMSDMIASDAQRHRAAPGADEVLTFNRGMLNSLLSVIAASSIVTLDAAKAASDARVLESAAVAKTDVLSLTTALTADVGALRDSVIALSKALLTIHATEKSS